MRLLATPLVVRVCSRCSEEGVKAEFLHTQLQTAGAARQPSGLTRRCGVSSDRGTACVTGLASSAALRAPTQTVPSLLALPASSLLSSQQESHRFLILAASPTYLLSSR